MYFCIKRIYGSRRTKWQIYLEFKGQQSQNILSISLKVVNYRKVQLVPFWNILLWMEKNIRPNFTIWMSSLQLAIGLILSRPPISEFGQLKSCASICLKALLWMIIVSNMDNLLARIILKNYLKECALLELVSEEFIRK